MVHTFQPSFFWGGGAPQIYFGGSLSESPHAGAMGFTSALSQHGLTQYQCNVVDYTEPPADVIRGAVEFIKSQVEAGKSIYVHCKAGRGRSVCIAVCYIAMFEIKGGVFESKVAAAKVVNEDLKKVRNVVDVYHRTGVVEFLTTG